VGWQQKAFSLLDDNVLELAIIHHLKAHAVSAII